VAEELADEVGDLPLALEQAAGYIETNGTPPEQYLALFRSAREQLLSEGAVVDHVLLDATWQVSFDQLQHDEPAAVLLLQQAAFLAPEPLPMWIFDELGSALLPEALRQAVAEPVARDRVLGALHRYALARRAADSLQMHRLVQAAVRRSLTPDQREAKQLAALEALRAVLPKAVYGEPESWPRWQNPAARTWQGLPLEQEMRNMRRSGSWHGSDSAMWPRGRGTPCRDLVR
jgi:hypothetical protein